MPITWNKNIDYSTSKSLSISKYCRCIFPDFQYFLKIFFYRMPFILTLTFVSSCLILNDNHIPKDEVYRYHHPRKLLGEHTWRVCRSEWCLNTRTHLYHVTTPGGVSCITSLVTCHLVSSRAIYPEPHSHCLTFVISDRIWSIRLYMIFQETNHMLRCPWF